MIPAFATKRMMVFEVVCERDAENWYDKTVYLAFWDCLDEPAVICTATVSMGTLIGDYVEWIETKSDERRKGVATELLLGIEKYLGRELTAEGVTPEGEALCAAIEKGGA